MGFMLGEVLVRIIRGLGLYIQKPVMKQKPEPIKARSFRFAVAIVRFCKDLRQLHEYEIANQLIRSGSSIGANIREATNGYSKRDYYYKLTLAQKETDETLYWLEILQEINIKPDSITPLITEAEQLLKIIRTLTLKIKNDLPPH